MMIDSEIVVLSLVGALDRGGPGERPHEKLENAVPMTTTVIPNLAIPTGTRPRSQITEARSDYRKGWRIAGEWRGQRD